jgi:hypothetical protein
MGIFLGYVASLVSTFILAAGILGAVTSFIDTDMHRKIEYVPQHKLSSKHISSRHRDHRIVARGTKDKSKVVTADAAL